jgi:anaerobic ribonucleoside-triphosphate reductase activating protein
LTTDLVLRINRFLPRTRVEGPGDRACVWVQGCPIHCPGCAVPETWDLDGGEEVPVAELAEDILAVPGLEGLTLTGGEPFAQAAPLAELCRMVQDAGLSVITFSGYPYERLLESDDPATGELLSVTDILLDGPFKEEAFDLGRPWVGSSNQGFRFLSPRYREIESSLSEIPNRVEIRLGQDGIIRVNGMADFKKLKPMIGQEYSGSNP